jgi:hypothetical protein
MTLFARNCGEDHSPQKQDTTVCQAIADNFQP